MLQILPQSHLDHGLKQEHIDWLLERFKDREAFFIETVELPTELPPLMCALYGPTMGDPPVVESPDVRYIVRRPRKWTSRVVDRPDRPTRLVTIIAGPSEGHACVLYTSYGGPAAPREPGDQAIDTGENWLEARDFWAEHALGDTWKKDLEELFPPKG